MERSDLIPIIAQEECAEVIQAISKVFRFGLEQRHPVTGIDNATHLAEEVGQLKYMLDCLIEYYGLCEATGANAYYSKQAALDKYADYFPF